MRITRSVLYERMLTSAEALDGIACKGLASTVKAGATAPIIRQWEESFEAVI